MPKVPPLYPHCNPIEENKKPLVEDSKTAFLRAVPPCNPFSEEKRSLKSSNIKNSKNTRIYITMEKKGGTRGTNQPPDSRFKSPIFRQNVRQFLDSIGLKPTYNSFKLWDKFVDWEQVNFSPKKVAICYLLDAKNRRVRTDGRDVTVGLAVHSLADIDKRYYEFKEWWS